MTGKNLHEKASAHRALPTGGGDGGDQAVAADHRGGWVTGVTVECSASRSSWDIKTRRWTKSSIESSKLNRALLPKDKHHHTLERRLQARSLTRGACGTGDRSETPMPVLSLPLSTCHRLRRRPRRRRRRLDRLHRRLRMYIRRSASARIRQSTCAWRGSSASARLEREREDEAEFERLVDQGMHIEGGILEYLELEVGLEDETEFERLVARMCCAHAR